MFESGKKQQKTAKNSEEKPCLLPTPEQVLQIWYTNFESLLKCSDNHDPQKLQEFESDILNYIKSHSNIL